MTRYIVRRLLMSVFVLFGVSLVVSAMVLIAGDPVTVMLQGGVASEEDRAALRRELGFDQPFLIQYGRFISGALRGDLGPSLRFREPAIEVVAQRLPSTFRLAIAAMLFSATIAIPLGILSASRPNSFVDYFARVLASLGQSVPLFWLGIMLVLLFSVHLRWLPTSGQTDPRAIILPTITLGLYPIARITRILRASMLEVLSREYVLTARSKGLSDRDVLLRHALRNAALPVITVIGLQFGTLLGGAVVTETIFAWPGVGQLLIQATDARDVPLVRAIVLVLSVSFLLVNLLTDLAYAYLNPRIRYA